jgi:hypothetical protein
MEARDGVVHAVAHHCAAAMQQAGTGAVKGNALKIGRNRKCSAVKHTIGA